MIIKDMRWGYDGGGIACGPVDGSLLVELMVADETGALQFVVGSQFTDCFKMTVSPFSTFDILMQFVRHDINFEHEFKKIQQVAAESYDYEMYDYPQKMLCSKFLNVFKLAHLALDNCPSDDGEDFDGAKKFIAEYLNRDVNQIKDLNLPTEDEPIHC